MINHLLIYLLDHDFPLFIEYLETIRNIGIICLPNYNIIIK